MCLFSSLRRKSWKSQELVINREREQIVANFVSQIMEQIVAVFVSQITEEAIVKYVQFRTTGACAECHGMSSRGNADSPASRSAMTKCEAQTPSKRDADHAVHVPVPQMVEVTLEARQLGPLKRSHPRVVEQRVNSSVQ